MPWVLPWVHLMIVKPPTEVSIFPKSLSNNLKVTAARRRPCNISFVTLESDMFSRGSSEAACTLSWENSRLACEPCSHFTHIHPHLDEQKTWLFLFLLGISQPFTRGSDRPTQLHDLFQHLAVGDVGDVGDRWCDHRNPWIDDISWVESDKSLRYLRYRWDMHINIYIYIYIHIIIYICIMPFRHAFLQNVAKRKNQGGGLFPGCIASRVTSRGVWQLRR